MIIVKIYLGISLELLWAVSSVSDSSLFQLVLFLKVYKPLPKLQFSSVTQSYLTLCNCINCSTPSLPVHHQLPEFTQTRVR